MSIKKLRPQFLENKKKAASIAQKALRSGDINEVRRFGHMLRGDSAPYGFQSLGQLGKELEELTISEPTNIKQMTNQLERIQNEIKIETLSKKDLVLELRKVLELQDKSENSNSLKKQAKYGQLFDSMSEMLQVSEIIYDDQGNAIDGRFLLVNTAFENLVNKRRSDLLGNRATEIFGAIEDYWFKAVERVEKYGRPETYENYSQELDRYFSVNFWKAGNNKIVTIINDVTERKKNEELLDKKQQELLTIVENSTDYIMRFDKKGNCVFSSTKALKFFELKQYDYKGKSLSELGFPVYIRETLESLIPQVVTTASHASFEYQAAHDNRDYFMEIKLFPEFDKNQEVVSVLGIASDVTEKKRNMELAVENRSFALASAAKSDFIANISHEIRTPLSTIIGFAELLSQKNLDAQHKEFVDRIFTGSSHLKNLVDDILDLSKIESAKIGIEHFPFELRNQLQDTFEIFKDQALRKNIGFTVEYDKNLPEIMIGDKTRLMQIIYNLIGNAIKFTSSGGIHIRCSCVFPKRSSTGSLLKIEITDTGCGISWADQATLFEPFTQATKKKDFQHEGTGLGLCISKKLAQAMGGDVILQNSQVQQGTTFIVTINTGLVDTFNFELAQRPKVTQSSQPKSLTNCKILVAEDSLDLGKFIFEVLSHAGAKVEFAKNGKEAIEKTKNHNYDIILMDIQMPNMDGLTALPHIKKMGLSTPIIAQTAFTSKQNRDRYLAAGFDDCITKPYSVNELTTTIARNWSKSV